MKNHKCFIKLPRKGKAFLGENVKVCVSHMACHLLYNVVEVT